MGLVLGLRPGFRKQKERLRVIDIEEEQDGTAAIIDGGRDVAGDDTRVVVQRADLVRRRLNFQG